MTVLYPQRGEFNLVLFQFLQNTSGFEGACIKMIFPKRRIGEAGDIQIHREVTDEFQRSSLADNTRAALVRRFKSSVKGRHCIGSMLSQLQLLPST